MGKCDKKTCIISFIAVFAFLFGYDWLVHGTLFKPDYDALSGVITVRPEEEMKQLFIWCIAYHALLAAVVTCLFKKFRKGMIACCPESANTCCPIKTGGLCFGLKIGLLLALAHTSVYIWMPIPGALAVKWFIAYLVQGAGAGALLGILSGGKGSSCGTNSCGSKAS